jgi:Holliday junction resolvase RusA-like endonuclease
VTIEFFVPGKPETQGSIRAFTNRATGRAILTSTNAKLAPWRKAVAQAAAIASGGRLYQKCPVAVSAEFILPRLVSHPKTSRGITPHAMCKPDLDKLMRALGDGLESGGIIDEDSRIVEWKASKRYASNEEQPGARVVIRFLDIQTSTASGSRRLRQR